MKYLRLYETHDAYASESNEIPTPNVIWDGEHVHYVEKVSDEESEEEEEEEEPTDTTTIVE